MTTLATILGRSILGIAAFVVMGVAGAAGQVPVADAAGGNTTQTLGEFSRAPSAQCISRLEASEHAIQEEQFSIAIETAQSAIGLCENDRRARFDIARAKMLSGDFDAAIATLDELTAEAPASADEYILLGQASYLSDHDNEAKSAFERAIALAPGKPEPHYWLGRLEYQDKDIEHAIEQYLETIRIDNTFYKAYDNLGLCYADLNNEKLALDNYAKALALVYKDHPKYDSVYINLAAFMLRKNDSQKAFDFAAEAASRNPKNPESVLLAGRALQQAGHEDASLRWLRRAAAMDSSFPEPHYFMARLLKKQGKQAEAQTEAEVFRKLSEKAPKIKR